MLANLHIDEEAIKRARQYAEEDPKRAETINRMIPKEEEMKELGPGFYYSFQENFFIETSHLRYDNEFFIKNKVQQLYNEGMSIEDIFIKYHELASKSEYIVADDIDQIKDYFKQFIDDPDYDYAISLSYVWQRKLEEGESSYGGWRWHKWGPYVGNFEPEYEYLDDEEFGPDFKGYVICAHIKRLDKFEENK